jgi:hypothetical protein
MKQFRFALFCFASISRARAFAPWRPHRIFDLCPHEKRPCQLLSKCLGTTICYRSTITSRFAELDSSPLSESDQIFLGIAGTLAALITIYSEFTLKTTGCGLPAGPFGLVGAVEGISYLAIVGITAYSLVTKFRTGSGLPAGPAGVLGVAEGLCFTAIVTGLVVLGFQVVDYGYIPNAVPMEGGMCS